MRDSVKEAALKVLKGHEHAISVKQVGDQFELHMKPPQGDGEELEAFSALRAMSGFDTRVHYTQSLDIRMSARDTDPIPAPAEHPIAKIARDLANGDVNYPGSERFRTAGISR